jgi:hypothetical protein
VCLRHELSSLARTLGTCVTHLRHGCLVCVRVYSVSVVLCLGRGLATNRSLVQGVLSSVKMITELKKRPGPWMGWKSHWKRKYESCADLFGLEYEIISLLQVNDNKSLDWDNTMSVFILTKTQCSRISTLLSLLGLWNTELIFSGNSPNFHDCSGIYRPGVMLNFEHRSGARDNVPVGRMRNTY